MLENIFKNKEEEIKILSAIELRAESSKMRAQADVMAGIAEQILSPWMLQHDRQKVTHPSCGSIIYVPPGVTLTLNKDKIKDLLAEKAKVPIPLIEELFEQSTQSRIRAGYLRFMPTVVAG